MNIFVLNQLPIILNWEHTHLLIKLGSEERAYCIALAKGEF